MTGASQYHIIEIQTLLVCFIQRKSVYPERRATVRDAPMAAQSDTLDLVDGVPLHAEAWNGFLEPEMKHISKQ